MHRASKVLILGNMKMLLSTGTSLWNERQIVLWDQVRATDLFDLRSLLLSFQCPFWTLFMILPLSHFIC